MPGRHEMDPPLCGPASMSQNEFYSNPTNPSQSFLLEYSDQGRLPEVKKQLSARSLNASRIRDAARVWASRTDSVLPALRTQAAVRASVHTALLRTGKPAAIIVDMQHAGAAEGDAMGSCGGKQGNTRWLWHASEHHT